MPLKFHCDSCSQIVLGIFSGLRKVDGQFLCRPCANNAAANSKNPNLAKCPDCGNAISIRAAACPKCGAPQT